MTSKLNKVATHDELHYKYIAQWLTTQLCGQLFPDGKTGPPTPDWLFPQSVQTLCMELHHRVRDLGEVADAQAAAASWTETHMLQEVIQYGQEVGYLYCSCSPSEDRTPAPVSQSGYLAAVVLDFLCSSLLLSLCLSSNSKPRLSSSRPLFLSQASQPAPPSLSLPLSADAHSPSPPSSSAALFIAALRQQSLSFAVSLLICAVCASVCVCVRTSCCWITLQLELLLPSVGHKVAT